MVSMYALPYLGRIFNAFVWIVEFLIDLPANISERMEIIGYVRNCGRDNRSVLHPDQPLYYQLFRGFGPNSTHKSHEEHGEVKRYHDEDSFLLWRIVSLIFGNLGV